MVIGDDEVEIETGLVRVCSRGQITIPRKTRMHLGLAKGDMLALIQVDDIILLTPRQAQVTRLADEIVEVMEKENVSPADLLGGLDQEREVTWRERRKNT